MECEFIGVAILKLDVQENINKPRVESVSLDLMLSPNLDKDHYLDERGLPNKEGSYALSNVLVQGLVANIHQSHDNNFRDSAEHLRWIISELERGFIQVGTTVVEEIQVLKRQAKH